MLQSREYSFTGVLMMPPLLLYLMLEVSYFKV